MKIPNIVRVNRSVALSYLAKNSGNRDRREAVIGRYATAMLAGHWVLSPNGICFDKNGNLCNGQHRLYAVVLASLTKPDIEIEFFVFEDVSEEEALVLDVPIKRNVSDHTHYSEKYDKINNEVASTIRIVLTEGWGKNRHVGDRAIMEFSCQYAKEIEIVLALFQKSVRGITNAPVKGAFLRAYLSGVNLEGLKYASEFMLEGVQEETRPGLGSLVMLREYLKDTRIGTGPSRTEAHKYSAFFLHKFLNGVDYKQVRKANIKKLIVEDLFPMTFNYNEPTINTTLPIGVMLAIEEFVGHVGKTPFTLQQLGGYVLKKGVFHSKAANPITAFALKFRRAINKNGIGKLPIASGKIVPVIDLDSDIIRQYEFIKINPKS